MGEPVAIDCGRLAHDVGQAPVAQARLAAFVGHGDHSHTSKKGQIGAAMLHAAGDGVDNGRSERWQKRERETGPG